MTAHRTWSSMRSAMTEAALFSPTTSSADVTRAEKSSERVRFLAEFWSLAIARAQEKGLDPSSDEAWQMVLEADEVGEGITSGFYPVMLNPEYEKPENIKMANQLRINFESKPVDVLSTWDLRSRGCNSLYVATPDLEAASEAYFNSAWRSLHLDRFVLRLLLERELAGFVHEMARKDPIFNSPSSLAKAQAILRQTPLIQSLKVVFWTFVLVTSILGLSLAFPGLSEASFLIAASVVGFVGVIWLCLTVYYFSFSATKVKKAALKIVQMVDLASDVLLANNGNGPLAVTLFRRDLQRLHDVGFSLPNLLFGVIDELERKGIDRL